MDSPPKLTIYPEQQCFFFPLIPQNNTKMTAHTLYLFTVTLCIHGLVPGICYIIAAINSLSFILKILCIILIIIISDDQAYQLYESVGKCHRNDYITTSQAFVPQWYWEHWQHLYQHQDQDSLYVTCTFIQVQHVASWSLILPLDSAIQEFN